jgi:hypothetical protein
MLARTRRRVIDIHTVSARPPAGAHRHRAQDRPHVSRVLRRDQRPQPLGSRLPGGAPAGVIPPGCPAGFLPDCRRPPRSRITRHPLLTVRLPALRQTRQELGNDCFHCCAGFNRLAYMLMLLLKRRASCLAGYSIRTCLIWDLPGWRSAPSLHTTCRGTRPGQWCRCW